MEMPKPTDAHRKLHALAGRWIGQEKMHPSPWDTQGSIANAHIENKISVDGFLLVHDYEQSKNGIPNFHGHGVFSFDSNAQNYTMHWWDSMGMGANVFKGNFNGATLQMECRHERFATRATWEFPEPSRYRFKMETSGDGQTWAPMMDGEYTRAT